MCEPVSLTAGTLATMQLVVAATSAAAGVASAVMATNAQNKRSADNARSAKEAYILKTAAQNQRIRQEGIAAAQKKEDASLKSARSKATATAAAADGGVQGGSVQLLLQDYDRSEGVFRDRVAEQLDATTDAIRFDQLGFQAEADQRIASVPPAGMENVFGAALSGAGKVFSGYQDYSATINGED